MNKAALVQQCKNVKTRKEAFDAASKEALKEMHSPQGSENIPKRIHINFSLNKKEKPLMVAEMITVFCQESYYSSNTIYINFLEENKKEKGSNELANPIAITTSLPGYFYRGSTIFKSFVGLCKLRPDGEMVNAVVSKTASSYQGNMGSSPVQGAFPAFSPQFLTQRVSMHNEVEHE